MTHSDRRSFLGASLGVLSTAWAWPTAVSAQETAPATPKPPEYVLPKVSGPKTLFLTWHSDPTTTMVIQWVGSDMLASDVLYSELAMPMWLTAKTFSKPFPNTDLQVHRCILTGLKPETEYQFTVGIGGETLRFRTMPEKANDTIQFVSGGDAGVGVAAINTNNTAAKQEPYFALIGGDLAYDNGRSPATFLKFLENYRATMVDKNGRLIPMISCIGNHEVDGGYNGTREKSPQYLSVFDGFYKDTTYGVLDIGDYLSIVLLDTGHIAPIEGDQTSWLESTLAARQSVPHLFVGQHVPSYPSYRNYESTGKDSRRYWCPLFEKYNVDAVLEHHDHTFKRTHPLTNGMVDPNGVLYLGDGSWGKLRAPKDPEERPYLAKVGHSYHMTVHRLEGKERFHVALDDNGKVADVCRTINKRATTRG